MIGHGGGIYSYQFVTNPLGLTWGCSVLSLIVLSALLLLFHVGLIPMEVWRIPRLLLVSMQSY